MKTSVSLLIALTLFVNSAIFAATYGGGSGEPNNPYQIWTPQQMNTIGAEPNDWDKCFILMADVNMAAYTGTQYNIIGHSSTGFTGKFDGNNHKVGNLTYINTTNQNVGLFGYTYNAEIKNLGLENVNITGYGRTGGLIGVNNGTVYNCYSSGSVSGVWAVGGLMGENGSSSNVSNCYSACTVSGTDDSVGGLIGYIYDGATVSDCYSTGNVTGSDKVGGLIGESYNSTVNNCHSTGNVSGNSHGTEFYYSHVRTGGLIGENEGSISNCYSTGNVNSTIAYDGIYENTFEVCTGGLVGTNSDSLNNCYSTATVSYTAAGLSDYQYQASAGGMIGKNWGNMSNCYSTGAIDLDGNSIGGLVGEGANGTVNSCFWDIQTSGQQTSFGGKGLTTQQMKTMSIYQNAGWGNNGWVMENGLDYPHLEWEGTAGTPIPAPVIPLTGSGTLEDPYQIWTPEDFSALSRYQYICDKHIILMADLDLNGILIYPIGDLGTFNGNFNGNGHIIRNVTINQPNSSHVGVFREVGSDGKIENLGLEDVNITGSHYVGGLVGSNVGEIINCYSTGIVAGSHCVGGLIGFNNEEYKIISNCYSTCTVNGNDYVGGLIGVIEGTVSNCYSTGVVTGIRQVGGLIGHIHWADISNCYSTSTVDGNNSVGGLIGYNDDSKMKNCYSMGNVTGNDYVGGLIGASGEWGIITACFWDINTSGQINSAGGTGLTTAQMKDPLSFVEWNKCGDIWTIDSGVDYPRLAWEHKQGQVIDSIQLSDLLAGDGTQDNPYLIYTAADFQKMGIYSCQWYKHFKLMADIDMSQYPGAEYIVIGDYQTPFTGSFDGNGYVILNFTLNYTTQQPAGLFGVVYYGAQIKNLGIEDVNIIGLEFIGGLAYLNSGNITNCYLTGTITKSGDYWREIGGLIGRNYEGTISDCYVNVCISVSDSSGGALIGQNYKGIVTNCYAVGSLNGSGGGLMSSNVAGTVSNCYALVDVSGNNNGSNNGGLIGNNYAGSIVSNCYAAGMVNGTGDTGGLIGYHEFGDITACFWDVNSSGQINGVGSGSSAGTYGRTTTQMKQQATFTMSPYLWDFLGESTNGDNDYWRMCVDNVNYPRLTWEYTKNGDFACPDGVSYNDLQRLGNDWLVTYSTELYGADANGDKTVNFLDFAILAENWLQ